LLGPKDKAHKWGIPWYRKEKKIRLGQFNIPSAGGAMIAVLAISVTSAARRMGAVLAYGETI